MFPSTSMPKEDLAVFPKNTEDKFLIMESDANTNYSEYRQQYGNSSCQNNSGLLRFRSAPSSLLANFANGFDKCESLTSRVCPDEPNDTYGFENNDDGSNDRSIVKRLATMNSQLPPQYPRQNSAQSRSMTTDGGEYRVLSSMDSSLTRQNSSPAGLFSHPTAQNGYPTTRWIRDTSPSSNRLKNHVVFSSDMSSSLGMLSQITEVVNENSRANGLQDDAKVENSFDSNLFYNSELIPFGSWNDSSNFAGNFTSVIKREADNDANLFSNNQNMESGNGRPHTLSHSLSLPKTSTEMSTIKKLFHIQDAIPCKIRAKRGFATHPRSIAERIRRTRISERIRKLQELIPNMDKQQTNTADMLDLAVEHIKNLQKQYKKLSENRAKCKCLPSQEIV